MVEDKNEAMPRGTRLAITVVQLFALGIVSYFLVTWRGPWNLARYIGTVLFPIGVIGIVSARYSLGRSFAVRAEAHQLVTGGIYSKIRNPIYVFGTIAVLGVFLALQLRGPAPWIIIGAIVVGQTIRARREARVLEAAFGDAYREYRRKTWF
jgi:protein-S-isoprenylcysteine O-methyltransferase Ste14